MSYHIRCLQKSIFLHERIAQNAGNHFKKGCDFVTAQQGLRGYDTQTLLGPHWHFIRATPLPTELRGSVKLSDNHTETLNFRVR